MHKGSANIQSDSNNSRRNSSRSHRYHTQLRTVSALAMLWLGGCSEPAAPSARLDVSPKDVTLSVGSSQQFSALNAEGAVTWTSSDPAVAVVVSTGFTTALKSGSTQITAADTRGSSTATLTVRSLAALALTPGTISFTQQRGASDPAPQAVQVSDAGDDKVGAVTVAGIAYDPGQPTGWLTATLSSSAAPAQLSVRAQAGTMPVGSYRATVSVSAVGATNGSQPVVVTLAVTPAPAIQLSSTALSFTSLRAVGTVPAQTVNVTNSGGGTLTQLTAATVYAPGQATGWLAATLNTAAIPMSLSVQPTVGSLPDGTYNATVVVSAPGASNSPQSVAVTLTVTSNTIALSRTSVPFSGAVGGANPSVQTVGISNAGAGTLTGLAVAVSYRAGQTPGWLTTATLSSTTANSTLTLQPSVGALAPGTYNATVAVTAPGATNSPQIIAVTLTVATSPSIALSRTSVPFSAQLGGANPAVQTVTITNSGTGTLTGLAFTIGYQMGQPNGWLAGIATTGANGETIVSLQPTTGVLPVGTYNATVSMTSPVANNSPQNITVTFVISASPAIGVSTALVNFSGTAGFASPLSQVVIISNGGSGTLNQLSTSINYANGQPTGWLVASLSTTSAPATLTLTPTSGALPAGTYSATVSVISPMATNTPQFITITFVLGSAPTISLSATTRNFQINIGAAPPAAQTVTITNSGSGSLTGLNTSISYTAGQPTGWLSAALNTTTATSLLTLQPLTISPAQGGAFTATVSIASPVAGNSPRVITVTYTVMVSWATDIYPTIAVPANCLNCHFAGATTDLSSAQIAYTNLVNRVTTNRAGHPLASTKPVRVVPGNASTSYLLDQVLKTSGAYGMPTSATTMPAAWISRLREWINLGAPNN